MKTGKEIKINTFKDINVVFGTINNKNSKAVFVNISSWLDPKNDDDINYSKVIKDLNKKIKQTIFDYFYYLNDSSLLYDRTIVDLDIRESGVKFGKKSFMNCEITLFLNNETPVNTPLMKEKLFVVCEIITKEIFEKNKYFSFNKRKKIK